MTSLIPAATAAGAAHSASKALWYLTRGTGIVSMILLTSVTVLGILTTVRWSPGKTPRFVTQYLHRNLSLLSVAFIVVHVSTAVIDAFAPIHWLDAVVPFMSGYRPLWLGLGTVAFDLLVAIAVTSLVRARLGLGAWRVVHWTSYACWVVAIFHGLGVGSDAKQPWMLLLVAVSVGGVAAAAAWRVAVGWSGWVTPRVAMALGLVLVPIVLVAWVVAGPLQPGWAARAGTPPQLLPHTSVKSSPAPRLATPMFLPASSVGQGTTALHRLNAGRARVNITLATSGTPPLSIRVVMNGTQFGGGISMSSGSVILTPPRGAAAYTGQITALNGGVIGANLSDGQGDQIALTLQLQVGPSGQTTAQVSIGSAAAATSQGGF
jgi:sulfoxide reductase heme-binding subunit YedZ